MELCEITTPTTSLPVVVEVAPDPAKVRAALLARVIDAKEKGKQWIRQYEVPGRKMLYQVVGDAYSVFAEAEALPVDQRDSFYKLLDARLRDDKIRMHADAPRSALVIRSVFPTLDASRVSKYARALAAAKSYQIAAAGFVQFVKDAGGFEKVRHAPVLVVVPAKPAVPETVKEVVPVHIEEEADDLTEDEIADAEYRDELYGLLEGRKAQPFLTVTLSSVEQRARLEGGATAQPVVLVGEIVGDELRVYEHVPYLEEAMAQAFKVRYPTADLLRKATNGGDDGTA